MGTKARRVTTVLEPVAGAGAGGGVGMAKLPRQSRLYMLGESVSARSHTWEVEGGDWAETLGTDHTRSNFSSRLSIHVTLRVGLPAPSPS